AVTEGSNGKVMLPAADRIECAESRPSPHGSGRLRRRLAGSGVERRGLRSGYHAMRSNCGFGQLMKSMTVSMIRSTSVSLRAEQGVAHMPAVYGCGGEDRLQMHRLPQGSRLDAVRRQPCAQITGAEACPLLIDEDR